MSEHVVSAPALAARLALVVSLAACVHDSDSDVAVEALMTIAMKSAAFEPGAAIPKKHTGEGTDVSPPLSWGGVPAGTKEIALICDDPDAPSATPWVHWVLYKLPPDKTGLAAGENGGGLEGQNGWGTTGYRGPMPPPGHGVHHYHFKLYALDQALDAPAGLSKQQLLAAIEGHVLATGELIGTYRR